MQTIQQPTCTGIRIRTALDAQKIFFAVQQGILPKISRRLDADDRLALRSGCVYAWQERGGDPDVTGLGIERFTDGRKWSQSRVRDEFLFYYERYVNPQADARSSEAPKRPPRDWDQLIKQTYSVDVTSERGSKKWHLTAYFTQTAVDYLGTIDGIPLIRDLVVPEDLFKAIRSRPRKNRKGEESRRRAGDSKPTSSTVTRKYAAFPAPKESSPQEVALPALQLPLYEPYQQPIEYGQTPAYYPSDPADHVSPLDSSSLYSIPRTRSTPHDSYGTGGPYADSGCHFSALIDISNGSPTHCQASGAENTRPYIDPPASFLSRSSLVQCPEDSPVYLHPVSTTEEFLLGFSSPRYPSWSAQELYPDRQSNARAEIPAISPVRSCYPSSAADGYSGALASVPFTSVFPNEAPAYDGETKGSIASCRALVGLAPLQRVHPYRRDPLDDKALRLLGPRKS